MTVALTVAFVGMLTGGTATSLLYSGDLGPIATIVTAGAGVLGFTAASGGLLVTLLVLALP